MGQAEQLPDKPWSRSPEEIISELESQEQGLDAEQAEKRRRQFGANRLREIKRKSAWKILIDQFASLIIVLLGIASLAALLFGKWMEGIAIAVALVINAVIGFFTELKATRSMEALKKLGGMDATVRRSGETKKIAAQDVVPGDILVLEAGDMLPADVRLFEANNIQADESALTGESVPVNKGTQSVDAETPLAERSSILFKGTAVNKGSGMGVVVATGMQTELGTVASLAQAAGEEQTPLEKRLEILGRRLVYATFAIGVIVAASGFIGGKDWLLVLETAIAMAVAAVPEGLPIVSTIALARGMWRMAKRNALINRLSAVETLGSTTVIFSDKTGTLTENRMTVKRYALADGMVEVERGDEKNGFIRDGEKVEVEADDLLRRALKVGVLCNNAELGDPEDEAVGDPMEAALLVAGAATGMHRPDLLDEFPEIREEAFSRETKMMATYHRDPDGLRVSVKGAPEAVIDACTRVRSEKNGETADFSQQDHQLWRERNEELAGQGLRLLALAEKRVDDEDAEPYTELEFLGLVGLHDPPRDSARKAIATAREAGIRVIMVTGDHPVTARAIAADMNLNDREEAKVHEGRDLRDPSEMDEESRRDLLKTPVFARVSPEQKLNLIALHQEAGEIVAMTGDGVNDAPALKKADIGVAMGQRGTQVAKEAADMVLRDDEFASIMTAMHYGRVIFGNIRKFIYFLLSGNVSEVLIISLASLVGAPLPLLPLQILYINLIGDVFPALALGVGEGDPSIMKRPPRDPREPLLTRGHWLGIIGYSLVIGAVVLGAFAYGIDRMGLEEQAAVTISFLTLSFARLWHVFNMRDLDTGLINNDITRNPFIWGALAICIVLLLLAVYLPPLAVVLGVQPPSAAGWGLILGASLIPLVIGQLTKLRARFMDH